MKVIFGLFEDYQQADQAIRNLQAEEIGSGDLNAIILKSFAKNAMNDMGVDLEKVKVESSSEVGETQIAGLNKMMAGQQPVQIPGLGDVYAAGPQATILTKTAAAPGSTDGLKPALRQFDMPEEIAESYADGVETGGVLCFVRAEDQEAGKAGKILLSAGARQVASY